MHIASMNIENVPPFTTSVKLSLDRHVNVLIGPNASGKTTILRNLISRLPEPPNFGFELSDDWPSRDWQRIVRNRLRFPRNGSAYPRWRRSSDPSAQEVSEAANHIPWIYMPANRHELPPSHDSEAMRNLQASSWDRTAGVHNAIASLDLEHILSDSLYLFDGNSIRRACKAITDSFRMGRETEDDFMRKQEAKIKAYQCAHFICSDVLLGDLPPQDYIHRQPLQRGVGNVTNVYDDMGIFTTDQAGNLFAGDLSSGTQGSLLWIWHLALKMGVFYNFADNWTEAPAILMIDEIENNLHPTWQRRVIPALGKYFPNVQIFATTHSPFVVAGLSAGQLHLLDRDIRGEVTASTGDQDVIGWTVDQILQSFMGISDPTDMKTSYDNTVLRWLQYRPVQSESAEDWRQDNIRELRSLATPTREELTMLDWLEARGQLEGEAVEWKDEAVTELKSKISRNVQFGSALAAERQAFVERLTRLMANDRLAPDNTSAPEVS